MEFEGSLARESSSVGYSWVHRMNWERNSLRGGGGGGGEGGDVAGESNGEYLRWAGVQQPAVACV